MTEQDTEVKSVSIVQLGTIEAEGPADVVTRAAEMAGILASIIDSRKLYTMIQGRKYVTAEGWGLLGGMLGIIPREVNCVDLEGDYLATVELIRASDGAIVGRASALVSSDEHTWASRPRYARRSMAITRATSKAYRMGWSWVINLAGYEATPAEEMIGVVDGDYTHVEEPQPEAWDGPPMTIEQAAEVTNQSGISYIEIADETLMHMRRSLDKAISKNGHDPDLLVELRTKKEAIKTILQARRDGSI